MQFCICNNKTYICLTDFNVREQLINQKCTDMKSHSHASCDDCCGISHGLQSELLFININLPMCNHFFMHFLRSAIISGNLNLLSYGAWSQISLLKIGTVQLMWVEINGFCKTVHISECISYNSAGYLGMRILTAY